MNMLEFEYRVVGPEEFKQEWEEGKYAVQVGLKDVDFDISLGKAATMC